MIWQESLSRGHITALSASYQRSIIEEQLKAGQIKALCATSTLELGIDMGAVDLVIQIEAPPSVASGMQRIGRAGHSVDAVSEGVLFPKYRADLVACAAVTRAMHEGHIESTRFPVTLSTCSASNWSPSSPIRPASGPPLAPSR